MTVSNPEMSLPAKPQVCIIDGRVAVFLGADYKFMDLQSARKLSAQLQSEIARLERVNRMKARAEKKGAENASAS